MTKEFRPKPCPRCGENNRTVYKEGNIWRVVCDCGYKYRFFTTRAPLENEMTTSTVNIEPCKLCGRENMIIMHEDGAVRVHCHCGVSFAENLATFPANWNGDWEMTDYYCDTCGIIPCRLTTIGDVPPDTCPRKNSPNKAVWRKK